MRPTWVEVNLAAIAHNAGLLAELVYPAKLCAVVKANGYGHGLIPIAGTAIDAGAAMLAVALVEEGQQLRKADIQTPILVLSEPHPKQFPEVVAHGLTPTVYQPASISAANTAAKAANTKLPVHLKVDTGMARVGVAPDQIFGLANVIAAYDSLELAGVWTHCPLADTPDNSFTKNQIQRFTKILSQLRSDGHHGFCAHLGNSAVAMAYPNGHLDMVRCGIALYGIAPSLALDGHIALKPAMTVRSEVAMVKRIAAGTPVSYGHRYRAPQDTLLATIPVGYGDGWSRQLGLCGGEVLIGGQRRPIAGVITMDQTMVECSLAHPVEPGDEVILLGRQGSEEITATEIATRLDTIGYEVVCKLTQRMPLRYS